MGRKYQRGLVSAVVRHVRGVIEDGSSTLPLRGRGRVEGKRRSVSAFDFGLHRHQHVEEGA